MPRGTRFEVGAVIPSSDSPQPLVIFLIYRAFLLSALGISSAGPAGILYFAQKAEIHLEEIHSNVKFGLETVFFLLLPVLGLNVTCWRVFLPLLPALLVVKLELKQKKNK